MAIDHNGGNIQNAVTLEEHDGINNAKRVTIGAVSVAVPISFSGNVTLDDGSLVGIIGNVTLSDSKGFTGLNTVVNGAGDRFIGLTTSWVSGVAGNVTLSDSKTYVGLTTSTLGVGTQFVGLVTVVQSSSARTITGNVTLSDAKTYIGLVSVSGTVALSQSGTDNDIQVVGNVTLSDAKTYIGLVTASIGSIAVGANYIGLVSVNGSVVNLAGTNNIGSVSVLGGGIGLNAGVNSVGFASVTPVSSWPDPKTYIGLVTIGHTVTVAAHALTAGAAYVGLMTIDIGTTKAWSDPKTYIGLVTSTLAAVDTKSYLGLMTVSNAVAWTDPKTYIGLVTITGSLSQAAGNVTITDGKTYIGLVTATIGNSPVLAAGVAGIGFATVFNATAWPDPKTYIGLVTITGSLSPAAGNITITDGKTYIGGVTATLAAVNTNAFLGLVTVAPHALTASTVNIGSVSILGGTAWANPNTYIGLVTNTPAAVDTKVYIGLVTSTNGVGTTFIGLVTAWTRNAGTAKTLTPYAFTLSTSSVTTIAVPTNAQAMYITNMILSSDATVRVSIKSGVTYMTGNASLGIVLNPGGGFIQSGAPDSPSWIGLPSGALVVEKFDMTATKANIGGTLVTFTE